MRSGWSAATVFGAVETEYALTRDAVLRAAGHAELMDADPVIQRSVQLRNPYVETLVIVACYGVGFAIVGNVLGPRLERTIRDGERSTHRGNGVVGTLFFFAVAYGLIYLLFFLIETRGVQVLLPPAWR